MTTIGAIAVAALLSSRQPLGMDVTPDDVKAGTAVM
jgi:hypothetical protein